MAWECDAIAGNLFGNDIVACLAVCRWRPLTMGVWHGAGTGEAIGARLSAPASGSLPTAVAKLHGPRNGEGPAAHGRGILSGGLENRGTDRGKRAAVNRSASAKTAVLAKTG